MKTKTNSKNKTKSRNKSKTNSRNKTKSRTRTKKGGGILDSIGSAIVQVPKKKDYSVHIPGSDLAKTLSSFTKTEKEQILKIIFNYRKSNQIDITTISPNKLISSDSITNEPYVLLNSMGKYLIVMYREVIKKNIPTPKLLLHFLLGYINRSPTKIFSYIAPNPKFGKTQKFIIKLYKYPPTDTTSNFLKINNFKKQKAYEEFNTYINNNKLLPINTFSFLVKGEASAGINLLNILSQSKKSKEGIKLIT